MSRKRVLQIRRTSEKGTNFGWIKSLELRKIQREILIRRSGSDQGDGRKWKKEPLSSGSKIVPCTEFSGIMSIHTSTLI